MLILAFAFVIWMIVFVFMRMLVFQLLFMLKSIAIIVFILMCIYTYALRFQSWPRGVLKSSANSGAG